MPETQNNSHGTIVQKDTKIQSFHPTKKERKLFMVYEQDGQKFQARVWLGEPFVKKRDNDHFFEEVIFKKNGHTVKEVGTVSHKLTKQQELNLINTRLTKDLLDEHFKGGIPSYVSFSSGFEGKKISAT